MKNKIIFLTKIFTLCDFDCLARISITVKSRIRIRITMNSRIRIRVKVKRRIRIRLFNLMQIHNNFFNPILQSRFFRYLYYKNRNWDLKRRFIFFKLGNDDWNVVDSDYDPVDP
jgi:hypothetical protein